MSSSVSVNCGGRDVLFERALGGLPVPLLTALRGSGLDDAATLLHYPVDLEDEGERGVPSGATSTAHPSIPLLTTSSAAGGTGSSSSDRVVGACVVEMGGDPRTDHSLSVGTAGGIDVARSLQEEGGDPKTDQHVPSDFSLQTAGLSSESADSPHSGGLATQTAYFSTVSPALDPDFGLSHGSELRDAFPSSQEKTVLASDPVRFDGFPSSSHISEVRDGCPSTHIMDSTQSAKSTGFTPIFRISENSERLRESDPGVQIVPASRSPSELSAHQMGLSLAGASRMEDEPIHSIPGTSALAIERHEQLSISDRALLRKYGPSGQQQETIREPDTRHDSIPIIQRVDGHPLQGDLKLYDRMLLRKYSVSGNASMSSDCSSLASVAPFSPPVESSKKRRRFFKKGKLGREMKKEVGQVQEGSPCGFRSQVAEPPVRAVTSISYSPLTPGPSHFTLLYHTLVRDGALPLGYLQEFTSLEAPARRSANRLQASAVAVTDSAASMTLAALRRESEHRASMEKSILDQLVIAADMRPKKFRTKWQRIVYDGPTARKDAESAERDRWIQLLANLLRSTDTPMGKLIRENPSNVQLLGGGRRAGTLRSRVRSVQKFLGWLVASHCVGFPVHWRQLTEYLQVRYSEPCVRGSLKLVHSSYIFLQEVAGIEDKLTDSSMYVVALKELMSQAIPGKPPRQAPRFPTILLAAFEDMVLAIDRPVFIRVLSWWLLVQSWGTLRFDDHRALLPREFVVTSTGLQARLTRSKVSGSDKHLNYRTVIIHILRRTFNVKVGCLSGGICCGKAHLIKEIIYCQHRRTITRASKSKN